MLFMREGHVGRPDHQRHEPVAESAHQRRHEHEEDHDQAVRRDHDVEQMRVAGEDLEARMRQLGAHRDG
jgi:hypothetical protein